MTLAVAIDLAVEYVRSHPDEMTSAEVEEFCGMAETVYVLAHQAGLKEALPQRHELRSDVEAAELPPVTFVSKLNLPGDWSQRDDGSPLRPMWKLLDEVPKLPEPVFEIGVPPRWFKDMAALRRLAETTSPAEPLKVTFDDLEQIVLRRLKKKTLRNQKDKPDSVGQRGQAHLYLYSDCLKWWSRHPTWEPLPDESEARSRLS